MMAESIAKYPRENNEKFELMSGGMIVSAGINRFDKPKHVRTELIPGMKAVVILSGRMQIRVGHGVEREICGPAVLLLKTSASTPRDQVFAADVPVRYVLVHLNETVFGDHLSASLREALRQDGGSNEFEPVLLSSPAGRELQSLTSQILNCPIRGIERELYLGGKAMQLASLAISSCLSNATPGDRIALSSTENDRIRKARELLIASMRNPPSLESLAQKSGLNVRKLNVGFRRLFGATVFNFLQEYRLEQAYKLISSGEMSVSEAAYHVGYGAAHFATIFRKRFGISPSSLR